MIVLFIFQVDPFDSVTAHRQCLSTVSRYGQKNNSNNYTYVYNYTNEYFRVYYFVKCHIHVYP